MAEKKKFDPVTIMGLLLAVVLFIGGQWYVGIQRTKRLEAEKIAQEEEARLAALNPPPPGGEKPVMKAAGGSPAGNNDTPLTPVPPVPGAVASDEEPAPVDDAVVSSEKLKITFTSKGGTLKSVDLSNEFVDPTKKEHKGLELLAEIKAGKRTFGLRGFDIGPPGSVMRSGGAPGCRVWEGEETEKPAFSTETLDGRVWKLESDSKSFDAQGLWKIVYSTTVAKKYKITRTYTVYKDRYYILLDIGLQNNSDKPVCFSYSLHGPAGILLDGPKNNPKGSAQGVLVMAKIAARSQPAAGQEAEKPEVKMISADVAANPESTVSREQNVWAALKNRFYSAMLISIDPRQLIRISTYAIEPNVSSEDKRLAEPNLGIVGIRRQSDLVEAGKSSKSDAYALYTGPTNEGELETAEMQLAAADKLHLWTNVQYCDIMAWNWPRVDWIARQMMKLFTALYTLFGSYGLAVILMTLVVKLSLHPIQRKMMVSMNKVQKLQPELSKIREKYANQKSPESQQKLFAEQQDLMKKAGANPVAGCLPMLIQIPIFSALYGIFNHAFEIRGAQFLWIKDLSQQDTLVKLSFKLPLLGTDAINLLPILYTAMMILQTKMTPAPKNEDPQAEMSRKMMVYMPLIFFFLFYTMPSGLVLYFAASAMFSIAETYYIKNFIIKDPPADAPTVASVVPAK